MGSVKENKNGASRLVVVAGWLVCALLSVVTPVRAEDGPGEATAAGQIPAARLADIERKIEILTLEFERIRLGGGAVGSELGHPIGKANGSSEGDPARLVGTHGFGPAASKVYRAGHGVSLGGYGETLYENFRTRRDDDTPGGKINRLDFLRQILYVGYKFDDRFLLNVELEFEHASTGKAGEASVEFAYIDALLRPEVNARAGMILVPIGFVNELHEPTVFLGATRPAVERSILPTTWRENGLGLFGDIGPITYRTFLMAGLDASGFSSKGIRGGRQKGSKSKAEDFAFVTRIDLTAIPGIQAGVSGFVGGADQGLSKKEGGTIDVTVGLLEGRLEYRRRGVEARAMAVHTWIDGTESLNQVLGLKGHDRVGRRQFGGYLQLGYDLLARRSTAMSLIPFVRVERLDTQHRLESDERGDPSLDVTLRTYGVTFSPITQIACKAEVQDFDNRAGTGQDQVNVALGYIF